MKQIRSWVNSCESQRRARTCTKAQAPSAVFLFVLAVLCGRGVAQGRLPFSGLVRGCGSAQTLKARGDEAGGKLTCGSHRIVYGDETDCGNSAAYSACAKASRGGAPSSSNWPGCMRRSGARPRPRGGCTASARYMRRCVFMGFVCAPLARQASFKYGRGPDPPPHSTHEREQRALEPARAPPWPRGP